MKHIGLTLVASVVVASIALGTAGASTSYNVLGGTVQNGMLMSLTANQGVVEPANTRNASSVTGVITTDNTDIEQQEGQISVQSDGQAEVLVSTLNGPINVGDRISPSSIQGIGTKLATSGWIIGIAQADFNAQSKGALASNVTDTNGVPHQVFIGRVPVVLHVTYYGDGKSAVNTVQTFADKLAGKRASELGILLSFILLFVGLVIVGLVVNSTIRGSFTAISRQPLIRQTILRTLALSFLFAGGVLAAVLFGAYLLLRIL